MIAHPPCTHLAVSGARWFKEKQEEQKGSLQFVRELLAADIPHIALENPVSIISSRIRKPDQIIQPWQFHRIIVNCHGQILSNPTGCFANGCQGHINFALRLNPQNMILVATRLSFVSLWVRLLMTRSLLREGA